MLLIIMILSANGQNCTPDNGVNTSTVVRIQINIYLTYIDNDIITVCKYDN